MHFLLLFFLFVSCSKAEKRQEEQLKKFHQKMGYITRLKGQRQFIFPAIKKSAAPKYHFLRVSDTGLPLITKEYFRCKGSCSSGVRYLNSEIIFDCDGIKSHSLPIKEGKEFIYPILIQTLNVLQERLNKRITILEAHRCPKHNRFVDASYKNSFSKHQIGAKVTFYFEDVSCNTVLDILFQFFEGKKQKLFARKSGWANKYINVCLHKDVNENEQIGEYLSLEVLFDSQTQKRIEYTYQKAHRGIYYY